MYVVVVFPRTYISKDYRVNFSMEEKRSFTEVLWQSYKMIFALMFSAATPDEEEK